MRAPSCPEIGPDSGILAGLGQQRFDVVLAADAFGIVAPRGSSPSRALIIELSVQLDDGRLLAVGLGPPWKAPYRHRPQGLAYRTRREAAIWKDQTDNRSQRPG
jgi:hypothetical protein